MHKHIQISSVASSVPFDNSSNGYIATDVQSAIEEANKHLIAQEISATASATAGTGADVVLTGMTVTPSAGTYMVWFSCDVNSANAGAVVSVSIYVGGVQKSDSLRKLMPFAGGTLTSGSQRMPVATNGLVTVNGSQAIEIRWSTSSNAPTAADRTMNILRIL